MALCSCAQGKTAKDEPQAVANQPDCPKVGFEEMIRRCPTSQFRDGKTEDYMRDECSLTNFLRRPAQITAALQQFSL